MTSLMSKVKMETSLFYTYIHYRNDNNLPFYIGKGKDKRAYSYNNRNKHWKNVVNKAKGFYVKIVEVFVSEQEALDHEENLIRIYRLDFKLCNIADGGSKPVGEQFKKIISKAVSEANKKRVWTEEAKNKVSLSSKKLFKGVAKTQEHRKKLSNVKKGSKNPNCWISVICVTTGESFKSVSEAAEKTKADPSHIIKCCKGKLNKTRGLEFKYGN